MSCTPDFGALTSKRGGVQATLVAFDLVRLDGDDLRLSLIEARREKLMRLVRGADLDAALRVLREAGWREEDFARVLEMGRAAAARPRGERAGRVWRAAAQLRAALREVEG